MLFEEILHEHNKCFRKAKVYRDDVFHAKKGYRVLQNTSKKNKQTLKTRNKVAKRTKNI